MENVRNKFLFLHPNYFHELPEKELLKRKKSHLYFEF